MFSGPSDNTWMKGDTFLEVASVLVRTDLDNPVSFDSAVEVVKRYVRSKMKKGKGKEVAGKGGKVSTGLTQIKTTSNAKLEALETKDIFYLTRLQLSLPPSTLKLPRPRSPTRKLLVKARYPLPAEYRQSLEGASSTAALQSSMSASEVYANAPGISPERGRSEARREPPVSPDPHVTPFVYDASTPSLSRSTSSATGTSAIPTPLPMASPIDLTSPRSPLGAIHPSVRRVPSGSSTTSGRSMDHTGGARRAQKGQGGDEGDVKRMLEARIKALQSALESLDVNEEQDLATEATAKTEGHRRELPPLSPPPSAPLPPTPRTPPSSRAVQAGDSPQSMMPAFPNPPARTSTGALSASPSMDPEISDDPFAAPARSAWYERSREERERAVWLRNQEALGRIRVQIGEGYERDVVTPPPYYEA